MQPTVGWPRTSVLKDRLPLGRLLVWPLLLHFISVLLLAFMGPSAHAADVSEEVWRQLKSLPGIATRPGIKIPTLYVFFDPNCPWCAKLWTTTVNGHPFNEQPAVWIPVTYLGNDSVGKAVALSRSGKREDLSANFRRFDFERHGAAAAPLEPTPSEQRSLTRANTIWYALGGATPMMVYRERTGAAKAFLGLPPEALLNELTLSIAPSQLPAFAPSTQSGTDAARR